VSDGDTIVIAAPFLPAPLKPELAVRIYGVDTPEKGHRAQCTQEDSNSQFWLLESTELTRQKKDTELNVHKKTSERNWRVNLQLKPYNPQTSTRLLFMDGISLVVVYWETSW
jgi:hypothetical protein